MIQENNMDKELIFYCKDCGCLLDFEKKDGGIFVSSCEICNEERNEIFCNIIDKINKLEDK